jgi:hypothetical protein
LRQKRTTSVRYRVSIMDITISLFFHGAHGNQITPSLSALWADAGECAGATPDNRMI